MINLLILRLAWPRPRPRPRNKRDHASRSPTLRRARQARRADAPPRRPRPPSAAAPNRAPTRTPRPARPARVTDAAHTRDPLAGARATAMSMLSAPPSATVMLATLLSKVADAADATHHHARRRAARAHRLDAEHDRRHAVDMRRRSKRHAAKPRRRHRRRRDLKFVVVAKNRNSFFRRGRGRGRGRGRPRSARATPLPPCCRRAIDTTLVGSRCEATATLPSVERRNQIFRYFSAWPAVVVVVVDHALRAQPPSVHERMIQPESMLKSGH